MVMMTPAKSDDHRGMTNEEHSDQNVHI